MKKEYLVLIFLIVLYNLIFFGLSLSRHLSLNSTYLDLGLESQAVWNAAQGRWFETSFGPKGGVVSALSYHVTPIILFLAPLYKLFPSPVTLLLLQTITVSLGSLAVYLLAKKILDSVQLALVFSATYLLYPPLQYANLSDFHYVTLATTSLLFVFYFMLGKRWRLFYLSLVLSVFTKENVALVASFLGLYLLLVLKEKKKGIVIFLLFTIYFLLSVFYLMPVLGGGSGAVGRYGYLVQMSPSKLPDLLFNVDKIKYLFHLLISVGFLPLFSPLQLIPALSEFGLNLFSSYNPQWQVKFHYTAAITSFIFVSAIYGARRLKIFLESRRIRNPSLLITLLLVIPALTWSFLHSPAPWNLKFDPLKYQETKETNEALQILKLIPTGASVSAMNNLGPHLAHRRFLYRFPIKALEADYVIVDPSVVGKDFDLSQIETHDYQEKLLEMERYGRFKKVFASGRLLVYRRRSP